ncbi:shieldin complex subunit 1 isoform X1 [Neofelis nebulosa]|uniref:shieldin complex subunit 1 isoform X1 n=1 Tax=Neofelis nebulosa TaxID=61452 RepID=UPI00272DA71E|nr:shieldin complex subunit 1 isoform X1 [Neofelis nebulosa]
MPVRVAKMNKSGDYRCWQGCGETGTLLHCWWECKLVQPLWKTVWRFLKKLKIDLPHDPAIALLGIYPRDTGVQMHRGTCTPMFTVVLSTIAQLWKEPKCPSTDEWIKKMWFIYTMEYYLAMRENEIWPFAATWMELEGIVLSEIDTSNLNSEQNDSWTSENFWLDPSVKGQVKTKAEDDGLRKSLDRFYEVFGCPQPASGNALSAAVCQCLSQKINELKGQESRKYALRSFQMARVIFNRDGCSVLQRHSRDVHFYPSGEGSVSLDDEKPTPGLSKDIIHFLLQQNVMKDL